MIAALYFNFVFILSNNVDQNFDVNCGSRSLTIVCGTSNILHQLWNTASAVISAAGRSCVCVAASAINRAYFVNRSIITSIVLLPLVVVGRCVIKSIGMSSNLLLGIGNGYNKPFFNWFIVFDCWHS